MKALECYIDFKCPASYLAVQPTRKLAAELGAHIQWRPFDTRQQSVPERKPAETRGESHRRVRAVSRRAIHQLYAEVQGRILRFPEPPGTTRHALAALAILGPGSGAGDAFVDAALQAYWVDNADLDSAEVVNGLLRDTGSEPIAFDGQRHFEVLDCALQAADAAGIIDTPTYLVGGQVFLGREHLPWIRELLTT